MSHVQSRQPRTPDDRHGSPSSGGCSELARDPPQGAPARDPRVVRVLERTGGVADGAPEGEAVHNGRQVRQGKRETWLDPAHLGQQFKLVRAAAQLESGHELHRIQREPGSCEGPGQQPAGRFAQRDNPREQRQRHRQVCSHVRG